MLRILVVSLVSLSFAHTSVLYGQQKTESPPKVVQEKTETRQEKKPRGRDMGAMLIRGLKKTKGCIDVKTCQWSDGKQSIVAWFENKKAAVAWYYSGTHQAMMGGQTDGSTTTGKPLEHVKNDKQPIMVIASLTPSKKPELEGVKIPISQISIELFAALPGGAHVGGRVSPKGFKVPHMRDYTKKTDDAKSAKESVKVDGGK